MLLLDSAQSSQQHCFQVPPQDGTFGETFDLSSGCEEATVVHEKRIAPESCSSFVLLKKPRISNEVPQAAPTVGYESDDSVDDILNFNPFAQQKPDATSATVND